LKSMAWHIGGLILMAFAVEARAEMPAARQQVLLILLLPVLIVVLSWVAGYYAIRSARRRLRGKPPKSWSSKIGEAVIIVLVTLISLSMQGLASALIMIFLVWALIRIGEMIFYGIRCRRKERAPEENLTVSSNKLFTCGGCILLVVLFFTGFVVSMLKMKSQSAQFREKKRFVEFVRTELAWERLRKEDSLLAPISKNDDLKKDPILGGVADLVWKKKLLIEQDEGGLDSVFYLLPERVPMFPYNFMIKQPSYRADSKGTVRMAFVADALEKCPPGAEIIEAVSEDEIARQTDEIREKHHKLAKSREEGKQ